MPRFARFAWTLLAYDVAVVLWGAYVRATGSGAGCGRHWPLCNGEVLPRAVRVETLVELSHRLSSGVVLVGTLALLVWAWRAYPRGHRVRKGAAWTSVFAVSEAGIGAALVLFELVAHDASMKRALSVCMHLVNTFLLLASTTLTAWWGSGGAPLHVGRRRALAWILGVPAGLLVVVGASGAVTALGDTLFPPPSLAAGLAQDVAPGAHAFVRLRGLHPMLAALTAATIVICASAVRALQPARTVRVLSRALPSSRSRRWRRGCSTWRRSHRSRCSSCTSPSRTPCGSRSCSRPRRRWAKPPITRLSRCLRGAPTPRSGRGRDRRRRATFRRRPAAWSR